MILAAESSVDVPLMGHSNCKFALSVIDLKETSVGWMTLPVNGLL
jgi:hypothetical protein